MQHERDEREDDNVIEPSSKKEEKDSSQRVYHIFDDDLPVYDDEANLNSNIYLDEANDRND